MKSIQLTIALGLSLGLAAATMSRVAQAQSTGIDACSGLSEFPTEPRASQGDISVESRGLCKYLYGTDFVTIVSVINLAPTKEIRVALRRNPNAFTPAHWVDAVGNGYLDHGAAVAHIGQNEQGWDQFIIRQRFTNFQDTAAIRIIQGATVQEVQF
jgi:hypothetical protein